MGNPLLMRELSRKALSSGLYLHFVTTAAPARADKGKRKASLAVDTVDSTGVGGSGRVTTRAMQRSVATLEAELRAEPFYGYKRDVTTRPFVIEELDEDARKLWNGLQAHHKSLKILDLGDQNRNLFVKHLHNEMVIKATEGVVMSFLKRSPHLRNAHSADKPMSCDILSVSSPLVRVSFQARIYGSTYNLTCSSILFGGTDGQATMREGSMH